MGSLWREGGKGAVTALPEAMGAASGPGDPPGALLFLFCFFFFWGGNPLSCPDFPLEMWVRRGLPSPSQAFSSPQTQQRARAGAGPSPQTLPGSWSCLIPRRGGGRPGCEETQQGPAMAGEDLNRRRVRREGSSGGGDRQRSPGGGRPRPRVPPFASARRARERGRASGARARPPVPPPPPPPPLPPPPFPAAAMLDGACGCQTQPEAAAAAAGYRDIPLRVSRGPFPAPPAPSARSVREPRGARVREGERTDWRTVAAAAEEPPSAFPLSGGGAGWEREGGPPGLPAFPRGGSGASPTGCEAGRVADGSGRGGGPGDGRTDSRTDGGAAPAGGRGGLCCLRLGGQQQLLPIMAARRRGRESRERASGTRRVGAAGGGRGGRRTTTDTHDRPGPSPLGVRAGSCPKGFHRRLKV